VATTRENDRGKAIAGGARARGIGTNEAEEPTRADPGAAAGHARRHEALSWRGDVGDHRVRSLFGNGEGPVERTPRTEPEVPCPRLGWIGPISTFSFVPERPQQFSRYRNDQFDLVTE